MSFTMDYVRLFALLALMLPLYGGVRLWLLSEPPARTEVLIVPETVTVHVPVEVPVERVIFVPVPGSGFSPVEQTPEQEPVDAEDPESTLAPPFGFLNLEPAELSAQIDESPNTADVVPGAQGTESPASTSAAPVAQQTTASSGSPGTPPLPLARPPPPPIIPSDPEPITGPPSSQPTAASNPLSVRRASLSAPSVFALPVVVQPPPAPQAVQSFVLSAPAPGVAPENPKPQPKPTDNEVDKPKPKPTDDDDKPKPRWQKEGANDAVGKPADDDRKPEVAKYPGGFDWNEDQGKRQAAPTPGRENEDERERRVGAALATSPPTPASLPPTPERRDDPPRASTGERRDAPPPAPVTSAARNPGPPPAAPGGKPSSGSASGAARAGGQATTAGSATPRTTPPTQSPAQSPQRASASGQRPGSDARGGRGA